MLFSLRFLYVFVMTCFVPLQFNRCCCDRLRQVRRLDDAHRTLSTGASESTWRSGSRADRPIGSGDLQNFRGRSDLVGELGARSY